MRLPLLSLLLLLALPTITLASEANNCPRRMTAQCARVGDRLAANCKSTKDCRPISVRYACIGPYDLPCLPHRCPTPLIPCPPSACICAPEHKPAMFCFPCDETCIEPACHEPVTALFLEEGCDCGQHVCDCE